nr:uncharacterized protein LOC117218055 [Megalopta genalis]
MFSRTAKSIVKTIGQRKYHAGEENIKVTLMGGAGEIGRSLSQMMKQTSRLDPISLYNAASSSKRLPIRFHTVPEAEPPKHINSWMLTMLENTRTLPKYQPIREPIDYLTTGPSNTARNETDELVEVLRRLPIAEEAAADLPSKSSAIVSQGGSACVAGELRGPRVLGEMGPETIRQDGRIVTEIYKQLPELADRLGRDRAKRGGSRPALRQLSTLALSGNAARPATGPRKQDTVDLDGTVSTVQRVARTSEKSDRKRRKDERKPSNAAVLTAAEKRAPTDAEDRAAIDKRGPRSRKPKEARGPVEASSSTKKRGKSRNWTIPAALSDKKPKLLYGLVQQRRAPIAWFFSDLFQSRKNDAPNDSPNFKQPTRGKKLGPTRDSTEVGRDSPAKAGCGRQEISTSVTDLTGDYAAGLDVPKAEGITNVAEKPEETIDVSAIEDFGSASRTAAPSSSIETVSELSGPSRPLGTVSSKLALFLENLSINRRRSCSLSSLTSYHLDSLFAGEAAAPICDRLGSVRFSSKSGAAKSNWPKIAGIEKKREDGGKRTELKKAGGDGGTVGSCGGKTKSGLYGEPCKKLEAECGQTGDACKKFKKEELYGKDCKAAEDPCKGIRDEKLYGKRCRDFEDSFGPEDPLEKLWKEELYGKRCKEKKSTACGNAKCGKKSDPCGGDKKPEPCGGGKKHDPCGIGEKPDPCGGDKKPDPCGIKKPEPCGGKKDSDPCGGKKKDPCGQKPDPCGKKPDPCGKKKEDPCGKKPDPCGKKKEDPCGKKPDPCGKKKDPCGQKPDPCGKKEDPCGKKKEDPCGKKPDPCGKKKDPCGKKKQDRCGKKKQDRCGKKKQDPCGKKMMTPSEKKKPAEKKVPPPVIKKEKKDDKACPPVFRAPAGCPNDDKGGGKKFSTDSRIHARSISSYKTIRDTLSELPWIIDRSSMPELRPRIESRWSRPFDWIVVDS